MKSGVYTIYDRVAEEAGPIYTAKNDGVAVRSFRLATQQVKESEHILYCIGEFDSDAAIITDTTKRQVVIPEVINGNV